MDASSELGYAVVIRSGVGGESKRLRFGTRASHGGKARLGSTVSNLFVLALGSVICLNASIKYHIHNNN
jgi:hypothetical protein